MPKPNIVISVVAAVAVLVVAGVVLAGLAGDSPAAPPDGYKTFEAQIDGHTVSFAYPGAWGAVARSTEGGVQVFKALGPRGADGTRSIVRMTADPGTTISFDSQFGLIDAQDRLQLVNDRMVSREDIDVPGAENARRLVLDYDLKTAGGGTQRSRSSTVSARSADGLYVSLIADTPAADPAVDADAVLASLTLEG